MRSNDQRDGWISANSVIGGVSLLLSLVNFFLILYLWNSGPQDPESEVLAFSMTALQVVLGVLAILLALGAFAGFWMIRTSAVEAAREEARRKVNELAPQLLEESRRAGTSGQSNAADVGISTEQATDVMRSAQKLTEDN
jgi:hypothetical protein